MKAIILAAGKGTRVQELNKEIPKVLFDILGKPMLVWNIELLKKHGVNEIAVNTSHLAEKITSHLGNGEKFGVNIKYSYEPELLGTSGALNNFKDFLNETFFVIYGDIISQIDLSKLLDFHRRKNSKATLVVHKTDHPEDSDIAQIDKNNKIVNLFHKPGNTQFGDIGSAALYVVEPRVFDYLPQGKSDFIKDIFPKMIQNHEELYGYETNEFIKDAGTPERIKKVENYLRLNLQQ
ncbi:MAG: nucleotidyltransferase family protein [Candidatus Nanoarchaeia archaeon]|nr:nucleotidyltransferase family protein [Candidatus Nanoarchaeia archaeon]